MWTLSRRRGDESRARRRGGRRRRLVVVVLVVPRRRRWADIVLAVPVVLVVLFLLSSLGSGVGDDRLPRRLDAPLDRGPLRRNERAFVARVSIAIPRDAASWKAREAVLAEVAEFVASEIARIEPRRVEG